jgi:hypothetical protein
MGVPLLDVLLAVIRRGLRGRAVWSPDRGHLHHCLLERGLTVGQGLGLLGGLCLLTGAIATAAACWRQESIAWIGLPALLAVLIRARICGHHEWALLKAAAGQTLKTACRPLLLEPPPQHAHSRLAVLDSDLPHDILPLAANRATLRDAA